VAAGAPAGGGQRGAGGGGQRGGGGPTVDPGAYKVTLTVDGKDVATKRIVISLDPMFK